MKFLLPILLVLFGQVVNGMELDGIWVAGTIGSTTSVYVSVETFDDGSIFLTYTDFLNDRYFASKAVKVEDNELYIVESGYTIILHNMNDYENRSYLKFDLYFSPNPDDIASYEGAFYTFSKLDVEMFADKRGLFERLSLEEQAEAVLGK